MHLAKQVPSRISAPSFRPGLCVPNAREAEEYLPGTWGLEGGHGRVPEQKAHVPRHLGSYGTRSTIQGSCQQPGGGGQGWLCLEPVSAIPTPIHLLDGSHLEAAAFLRETRTRGCWYSQLLSLYLSLTEQVSLRLPKPQFPHL